MANEPVESQMPENGESPQEEPRIYTIVRGVNRGLYNRRNFIEKTVLTTAATTVITTGCNFIAKPVDVNATVEAAVAATDAAKKSSKSLVAAAEATRVAAAKNNPSTPTLAPTDAPTDTPTVTPIPPTDTPEATATPKGIITTIKGDKVNLRVGPGTGFPPITQLVAGTQVTLTSRLSDNSWVGVSLVDPKKKRTRGLGLDQNFAG